MGFISKFKFLQYKQPMGKLTMISVQDLFQWINLKQPREIRRSLFAINVVVFESVCTLREVAGTGGSTVYRNMQV